MARAWEVGESGVAVAVAVAVVASCDGIYSGICCCSAISCCNCVTDGVRDGGTVCDVNGMCDGAVMCDAMRCVMAWGDAVGDGSYRRADEMGAINADVDGDADTDVSMTAVDVAGESDMCMMSSSMSSTCVVSRCSDAIASCVCVCSLLCFHFSPLTAIICAAMNAHM